MSNTYYDYDEQFVAIEKEGKWECPLCIVVNENPYGEPCHKQRCEGCGHIIEII